MLTIRRAEYYLSGRKEPRAVEIVAYQGRSLASYAQPRDAACVVNGCLVKRGEFENKIPHDGSFLYFMEMEGAIVGLIPGLIIIAIIVAIVQAIGSKSPSVRGAEATTRESGFGDESAAYGFNGIVNSTREGAAIPVVYGPHTIGGQIIQVWEEEGPNESQRLSMLVALSEGPVVRIGEQAADIDLPPGQGLGGLFINDLPVDGSLRGVQIGLRMGSDTQTYIPGFETINVSFSQDFELTGAGALTWATKDAVNEILVNLSFPSGLYATDKETGDTISESVGVNFKVFPSNESGAVLGAAVVNQSTTFTRSKRSAFYKMLRSGALGVGYYKVEVRRTFNIPPKYQQNNNQSVDHLRVTSIVERQYVTQNHPNIALIGLQIQANEQISGSQPKLTTFLVGRNLLGQTPLDGGDNSSPLNDGDSFSPALAAWDMLTNTRYGMGSIIDPDDLDVESFQAWADYCAELIPRFDGDEEINWVRRFQISCIYDAAGSAWEAVLRVSRMSRALIVQLGSVIRVKLETADRLPVMLFTMGNIIPDTLTISYIPKRERSNVIEVEYLDGRRPIYERLTETVEDPQLIAEGQDERRQTLDAFGVTLWHQARRWASFLARQERMIDKRLSFNTGLEAVVLEPGDVILISHDMPAWAFSGRLTGVNGDGNVTLDRAVTIEADVLYTYLEADIDGDIQETTFSVASADAGELTALPLTPLTSGGEVEGRCYVVGRAVTTRKEWLIERMERVDEREIKIECLPYIPEIYSDSSEPFPNDLVDDEVLEVPDPVEDLAAVETWVSDGISEVELTWAEPAGGPEPSRYGIWVSINGESFIGLNETTDLTYSHEFELPEGTQLIFAVVAYLSTGQGLLLEEAAQVSLVLLRDDATDDVPTRPEGMASISAPSVVQQGSTTLYDVTWTHPGAETLSTVRYDLRWGGWSAGGVVAATLNAVTATVRASAVARRLYLRARRIGNVIYSASPKVIELPATTHPTYATPAGEVALSPAGATIANGAVATWLEQRVVIYQIVETLAVAFESPVVDTGGVQATYVAWDIICQPAFFGSSDFTRIGYWRDDWAWTGDIENAYIDWNWTLRYKSSLGDAWTEITDGKAQFADDLVVTGRYFQVVVSATRLDNAAVEAAVVMPPHKSRAMIERCSVKFFKV